MAQLTETLSNSLFLGQRKYIGSIHKISATTLVNRYELI
jgi:hypothetical protein